MIAIKRLLPLLVILPILGALSFYVVNQAPGYSPQSSAQTALHSIRANLSRQESILVHDQHKNLQLLAAIKQLNQQISQMQAHYQDHLLSLARQGLIRLNH